MMTDRLRILAAQVALILAAGALTFAGGITIGFGATGLGAGMEGAAFLALLAATFFGEF